MHERWNKVDRPLILASQSPRRKEILTAMGLSFTIYPPKIDNEENFFVGKSIKSAVQELATAKAATISNHHGSSLVLGCDTIVVVDKEVIGKPRSKNDAKTMLHKLAGKKHIVYSGVALLCADINFEETTICSSEVFFRDLQEWEIDEYLAHNEYADKAGAYAIQGKAMTFIDKIDGCFYNVMGLPISQTITLFKAYISFLKGTH